MSYDLLIGLPQNRIIRSSELASYLNAERSTAKSQRAADLSELPARIQFVVHGLRTQWPGLRAFKPGLPAADPPGYWLGPSSIYASFDPSQAARAHQAVTQLVIEHEAFYFDPASGGWLDAQRPQGDVIGIPGFTSERCVMQTVAMSDLDLLLDPKWLVEERFFCFAPGEAHFLQVLHHRDEIFIEFCSGLGRPIHRTRMTSLEPVAKLLAGYLRGEDMNTPENRFAPLGSANEDIGLPTRDHHGRWFRVVPSANVELRFDWQDR
jgi:hypothetical protein